MSPLGLAQALGLRVLHAIPGHGLGADEAIDGALQGDMNGLALDGSVPERLGANYRSGSLRYDGSYCAHRRDTAVRGAGSHSHIRSVDVPHWERDCAGVRLLNFGGAHDGCLIQRKEDDGARPKSVASPLEHAVVQAAVVALVAEE